MLFICFFLLDSDRARMEVLDECHLGSMVGSERAYPESVELPIARVTGDSP